MDFYDDIALRYDEITSGPRRAALAESFARELIARYAPQSALDVACGTGTYTIPLAKAGLRTVGADLSPGMIEQARLRARWPGVAVDWVIAPMQSLAAHVRERFDTVLCMGNSIPHLLSDSDLEASLRGFGELANPGGLVILQLLNYTRVLARQERIVGIDRMEERQYVRFYDFLGDRVRFNILEIVWQGKNDCRHQLHTTTLRPYTHSMLRDALNRCGWRSVEIFSNLKFDRFDAEESDTVMLLARKT